MQGIHFVANAGKRVRLLIAVLLVILTALPGKPVQAGEPEPTGPEPVLVSDLRHGAGSSSPASLVAIGSTLFFSASDGLSGRELWKTSPPYTSTQRVADICPGGCDSFPNWLAVGGTTLFFSATDGKTGYELWRSDPPYDQSSTALVQDINPNGDSLPQEIVSIGASIFFSADDGVHGRELWRSDQPYHEASMVKDIFPGDGSSSPHDLKTIGWMLFFIADDSTGPEVWRSDPPYSAASTFRVTRINTHGDSSNVKFLTPMGLKLFFSANDGETGQELYMIESPYLDATRVTDISGNAFSSNPTDLHAIGDNLFFTATIGFVGFTGAELFRTDPPYTPTSTYLVKDIRAGMIGSYPDNKINIGTTLIFTADDGIHGRELWTSFPPYKPENTALLYDVRKGPASSDPQGMTAIGTTLFFTADDGYNGAELWKSEPPYSDTTTTLVADIYRGSGSSNPHSFYALDRTLFFAATSAPDGKELYRVGGPYSMPATGFAPGVVTRVGSQPASKAYRAMDDLSLEIPSLQVNTSIVGVPVSSDGWDLDWLGEQVGYLSGTAYPTWAGNTVLTGHVYLANGKEGPFVNLSKLSWGSQVVLRAFGDTYIYEVREIQSISPRNTQAVFKHEDRSWLTLVTCQQFDAQTGAYQARLVVRAVLVKVILGG